MNQKNEIINKLRGSGLRPTKQRILIAKNLFDNNKTFHFTVETLNRKINKLGNEKISLATIYNTVEAFTNAGYLKEILTSKNKSYYDMTCNGESVRDHTEHITKKYKHK